MKFEELQLQEDILRAVKEEGYTEPSPIQEEAIPPVLLGRDLLGTAQTGTGKTAAFALPIIQSIINKRNNNKKRKIGAIILTPTRELALQISESFEAYGKYTTVKCTAIFGGVSEKPQISAVRNGVDVLVATPGRLIDLLDRQEIDLRHIHTFVMDEADRMLDMGFIHDVKRIIKWLPIERQTLLFSATMPPEIQKLSAKLLKNPVRIEVAPVSSTVDIIDQTVYFVDKANKKLLLIDLLKKNKFSSVLVFTRTKHGADRVVKDLKRVAMEALAIHGNKSQGARQTALQAFKTGEIKVLVATDIAARGIDIDELTCVVNYDLPNISETYVHRIGRTGRAGLGGRAIAFCDIDEKAYLKDIEKLINKKIEVVEGHKYPMEILEPVPKDIKKQLDRIEKHGLQSNKPKTNPKNKQTQKSRPTQKSKPQSRQATATAKKPSDTQAKGKPHRSTDKSAKRTTKR